MADVITLNEIDEIKNLLTGNVSDTASLVSLIGSTSDTGATETQGTMMGKINALLSKSDAVISNNNEHGTQTFTSSGTWVCPTGVYSVLAYGYGGTGGGGGGGGGWDSSENYHGGSGGGSGSVGEIVCVVLPVTPGTSYTVTIGAAGTAGAAGVNNSTTYGGNGGSGGATKFGALLTINGGIGGSGAVSYYYNGGYNYTTSTPGSAGGVNYSDTKNMYLYRIMSVPGAKGESGEYSTSKYGTGNGGAGGAAPFNGIYGGKGGNGATCGYSSSDVAPQAGGAGTKGYLKIIW